jgi:hypothetical protein
MLLVVTLVCIFVGNAMYRANQQRRVLEFLRKYDICSIGYDRKPEKTWAPAWLRKVVGDDYFVNVESVTFNSSFNCLRIADAIDQLRRLPTLQSVDLKSPPFSGSGDFRELAMLTQIKRLGLTVETGDDKGVPLNYLTSMNNLTELDLSGCKISKENMQSLAKLAELKTLSLDSNDIDDERICQLAGCPQLETLSLSSCRISNKGLEAVASIRTLKNLTFVNMSVALATQRYPLATNTPHENSAGAQDGLERYNFELDPAFLFWGTEKVGEIPGLDPVRNQGLLQAWFANAAPV